MLKKDKLSKLDIGVDVDLMICVANLIKLEEHYANSYEQTRDPVFLKLWHETRMDRGRLMTILLKTLGVDFEKVEKTGDTWCLPPNSFIFKNPFSASINKLLRIGRVVAFEDVMLTPAPILFKISLLCPPSPKVQSTTVIPVRRFKRSSVSFSNTGIWL